METTQNILKTSQALIALVFTLALSIAATTATATAETAELKVHGDLVMHPDQIASFLQIATDQIRTSPNWEWPEVRFAKPYKTSWSQVQARGPFELMLSSENLKNQELGFEFSWNDPTISVGQFQIDDTITRVIGGSTVIIRLAGKCEGMQLVVPNGQWKLKGRLSWAWNGGAVEVKWLDFAFTRNGSAVAQTDLGVCAGPSGLQPALRQAIDAISQDPVWLQDVLRDGVSQWIENSLGSLQGELMQPRLFTLSAGLNARWTPEGLSGLEGGLVRVAGHFDLSKDSRVKSETVLPRSYSETSLASVQDSGFILPKDTLQALLNFSFQQGELQYRTSSDKIEAFQNLMRSRFMQFFVWPDLMQFAKSVIFYFDVTTAAAPQLTRGALRSGTLGGVVYDVQAPLLVHQWAPAGTKYVPYVDFRSQMRGQLGLYVQEQNLHLEFAPQTLEITSSFRSEFKSVRKVSSRLATSLLSSRVQSYIADKPLVLPLRQLQLGEHLSLRIQDVQTWKQSFRIPLALKNSK